MCTDAKRTCGAYGNKGRNSVAWFISPKTPSHVHVWEHVFFIPISPTDFHLERIESQQIHGLFDHYSPPHEGCRVLAAPKQGKCFPVKRLCLFSAYLTPFPGQTGKVCEGSSYYET